MEEDIQQIKTNIENYIISSQKYNIKKENIQIELKKIGGFSNFNYMGIIKDISTNEIIEHIFYREFGSKFGPLSDSVNHEQESKITNFLAEKEYGPKLLFEVKDKFTISEFLINTKSLPEEKYFDKNIIEQLLTILNYFTSFSYIYKYQITDNNIKLKPIKDNSSNDNKISLSKNQYEKCVGDIYDKGRDIFKKFSEQFKQKYKKEKSPEEWNDVELIQNYIDNFKNVYNENFPSKGFLVINHNDVFSSNILYREKDEKIFLIDHEYFILSLPGNDIAYYLAETFFNIEPEYLCKLDRINFDEIFEFYKNFIHKFIESNKFIEKEEFGKEFIEMIKTKEYFLKLMNITNLYIFIWAVGNVDFCKWEKEGVKEFFFAHARDRIKFYLLGMKAIQQLKNN